MSRPAPSPEPGPSAVVPKAKPREHIGVAYCERKPSNTVKRLKDLYAALISILACLLHK